MIHFTRKEFRCACGCGMDSVDYELAEVLDELRANFNLPITVTSGNRCATHNKNIGGSDNSQHLYSKAADIYMIGVPPEEIYSYLDGMYPDTYGIGIYPSWVHIDVRKTKARW